MAAKHRNIKKDCYEYNCIIFFLNEDSVFADSTSGGKLIHKY